MRGIHRIVKGGILAAATLAVGMAVAPVAAPSAAAATGSFRRSLSCRISNRRISNRRGWARHVQARHSLSSPTGCATAPQPAYGQVPKTSSTDPCRTLRGLPRHVAAFMPRAPGRVQE